MVIADERCIIMRNNVQTPDGIKHPGVGGLKSCIDLMKRSHTMMIDWNFSLRKCWYHTQGGGTKYYINEAHQFEQICNVTGECAEKC